MQTYFVEHWVCQHNLGVVILKIDDFRRIALMCKQEGSVFVDAIKEIRHLNPDCSLRVAKDVADYIRDI